jgi:hypothetical protein
LEVLGEFNYKKQTLIYIMLRFGNEHILKAILLSAPENIFNLTTDDGSTPVNGLMYEQGATLSPSIIAAFKYKVGADCWNKTNNIKILTDPYGESAAYWEAIRGLANYI